MGILVLVTCLCLVNSSGVGLEGRSRQAKEPLKVQVRGQRVIAIPTPALQRVLDQRFPGYALPLKEFTSQLLHDVAQGVSVQEATPFVCIGDFDGNGRLDVALSRIIH